MDYRDIEQNIFKNKADEIIGELPAFCKPFFSDLRANLMSEKTICGYATDIMIFFHFIATENSLYKNMEIREIEIEILENITADDITEYKTFLTNYVKEGIQRKNGGKGISRKLSSLRTMYKFFLARKAIRNNNNPLLDVSMPRTEKKEITQLGKEELNALRKKILNSDMPTKKQQSSCKNSMYRDLAIVFTLLGTGIRVSELVGLNVNEIDFKRKVFRIRRKGNKEQFVYFGDVTAEAIMDYLEYERDKMSDSPALFLSNRKERITARSVERIVEKYTNDPDVTIKHITPHKFRSTFGSFMYQETGDIYAVKEALGHEDVSTTIRHYAAFDPKKKEEVAKKADEIFNFDKKEN